MEAAAEQMINPGVNRPEVLNIENLNERTADCGRTFCFEEANEQINLPAFGNDNLQSFKGLRHGS